MQQDFFPFSEELKTLCAQTEKDAAANFAHIESVTEYNQNKVLKAFIDNHVSESMFAASTGYGYDDRGRDTLEKVFAQITGAQDALFRHNFVSGTHTISTALFGVLRPGDTMLCVTGTPYDTLHGVIGLSDGHGNLKEFGVLYEQIEMQNLSLIHISEPTRH